MATDGVRLRVVVAILTGFLVDGCFAPRTLPHSAGSMPTGNSVTGVASWYGPGFNGHPTSSGLIYNEDDLSAASTLFPLGTQLLVTNLANDQVVEVVVNDHG